jgi:hypothetical protein
MILKSHLRYWIFTIAKHLQVNVCKEMLIVHFIQVYERVVPLISFLQNDSNCVVPGHLFIEI